ncbi:MAG: 2Fe-2S iron-sulfur cluster-binding protein [Caldilineaceae bacterium]
MAPENGIEIPTLCHMEGLSDIGACRLCLVEVKGSRKLLPACITTVQEGMEVMTHSPKLDHYRRMIVEMLFAERNHVCSVCFQRPLRLAEPGHPLGVSHVTVPYLYPKLPIDASHDRFVLDHNRCVLCTRCVRVR